MKTKSNLLKMVVIVMAALFSSQLSAQGVSGNFNVTSDWGTGFCAEVVLTNNQNESINDWIYTFDQDAELTSFWNVGSWSGSQSDGYTSTDAGWNAVIAPGQSLTLGYCANYSGSIQPPTNAFINGISVAFGSGGSQTPPTITITNPVDGAVIQQNSSLILQANSTDSDGTVVAVDFNVDGTTIQATNTQGDVWQANWNAINVGNYTITASATDNDNLTSTATINIVVQGSGSQSPPSISITNPVGGAVIQQNSSIILQANSTDSDGTIVAVDFNVDGTTIQATNTQGDVWQANWNAVNAGNYTITATATDNDNLTSTATINIVVQGSTGGNSLVLTSLPLQINFNDGESITYDFDQNITNVLSRNLDVVDIVVSGNQVTLTGLKAGRTGLRIISGGQDYFMGVRVNNSDGSIPGMPDYVSVGSVSEDSDADLAFWKDVNIGQQNKSMDIRYIYINGGPLTGWQSWGPNRPETFAAESLRFGLIPFFVYYNIPDGGESYYTNTLHINDVNYMTAYFNDLNNFMDKAESVLQGELYGIILEPDFLGYIQQNGDPSDPELVTTCVSATNIAPQAGTLRTLVERINSTIENKRTQGHNIFYGWQLNLWSYPVSGAPQGVIRLTDQLGFDAGRSEIHNAAEQTTLYGIQAGVLSSNPNFLSIDKYGLDAMGYQNTPDPANSTWFFNNDHWMNYLYYAQTIHETSGFPVILWQLPVGHINNSQAISSYTGSPFVPLANTSTKFEDSSTPFFLGDTYTAANSDRLSYFTENLYGDTALQVSGNDITWGNHMQQVKDAGIISTLFGAGVGISTDGIGNPATDDYFWIQKVQDYYLDGPVDLDWNMFNVCSGGCPPNLSITAPLDGGQVVQSQLSAIDINVTAWDQDGQLNQLTVEIDGETFPLGTTGYTHTLSWTPSNFGTYVITCLATDNDGLTTSDSIVFSVIEFNPAACGVPLWESNIVYAQPGTQASWNGNIYENKWWTSGDEPGVGGWNDPWEFISQCTGSSSQVSNINESKNNELNLNIYPNPATQKVNISFLAARDDKAKIIIYNSMGKLVTKTNLKATNMGNNIITADVSMLSQGIYSVMVVVNDKVSTQMLVIAN